MSIFDYIIIGKNVGALAFADTILSGSDATMAIIDDTSSIERHRQNLTAYISGGLRDEHLGVSSYTFEDWRAEHGEAAHTMNDRDANLKAYCAHVLTQMMQPSGRVHVFERTDHFGGGRIRSKDTGVIQDLLVRKRIVDASYFPNSFCKSVVPGFSVARAVNVVRPFQLNTVLNLNATGFDLFCVLGGGRAGTEMVLALFDLGVSPEKIRWVKSRDAWMLAAPSKAAASVRARGRMTRQHEILQAMAYARDSDDLGLRLERLGAIVRTSNDQIPTYFLPHRITHHDAERLRQIQHVIRKGHVHAISEIGILLSHGAVPMPARSLYLDCTGHAGPRLGTRPVFQSQSLELADIRLDNPCFSAALIAAVELLDLPSHEKNKLCAPMRGGHIAELFLTSLLNHHAWFHDAALRRWIEGCRLDPWLQMSAHRLNKSQQVPQDLSAIRKILPRAIINLESMVQQDSNPARLDL